MSFLLRCPERCLKGCQDLPPGSGIDTPGASRRQTNNTKKVRQTKTIFYLSTYRPIDLPTYLSLYLPTYLPIYPPIHPQYLSLSLSLPLPLSICLSKIIKVSIYLSICLSIYLCMNQYHPCPLSPPAGVQVRFEGILHTERRHAPGATLHAARQRASGADRGHPAVPPGHGKAEKPWKTPDGQC
jgi:hypothetical protein